MTRSLVPITTGLAALAISLVAVAAPGRPPSTRLAPHARPVATARAVQAGPSGLASQVQSLFAQRCVACHGPSQQQGGLRLDRKADALKGGRTGPVIRPGASAESLLLRY